MTLFHGGTHVIERPVVITGDQGRDFGFAFYVTDIRDQAARWARRRARYRSRIAKCEVKGIVCEYEFDESGCGDLAIMRFPEPSLEWIDFVVANRSDIAYRHGYDLVIGKIANDRVGETISYVVQGVMRREDALERLRFQHINNQFAFCTEKAITRLRFVRSYEVENV
ncbi:MAG: DUF3990 domain-containing protein [Kiritimatiellia bacterium]